VKSCTTFVKNDITSIAIGGFDGMHLGHQALFKQLDEKGAIVVIQTSYANLTPYTYRCEKTDIPLVFYELKHIKHLKGDQFINLLMQEFPKLNKIIVGFDFCFGADAKYCIKELKELFDGEVVVIDEIELDGIGIHSRTIREYISNGNILKANRFLGYNYEIVGTIIKGQGLGQKQFVPTFNIYIEKFLIPKEGIYITKTQIDNIYYKSVTFIGHRVTTDGKFAVETHIIDQNINSNNNKLKIQFIDKLRDNQKFDSFDNLKNQILKDIEDTKKYFINDKSLDKVILDIISK
jgi:riboflavin kinase/FMN adenylyltransferase